jgi:glutamate formiminotransferase
MLPVLEAVPNVSEGRDPDRIQDLVAAVARTGVEVLDWSSDPDHHRSVLTLVGDPATIEQAALAMGRFVLEHLDLREHAGVHPRIGALDVLPLVPLVGMEMDDAVRWAHRIGAGLSELGLPVYWYGRASAHGRSLAELRRGGFETLVAGPPPGREPDLPAPGRPGLHPSAGAVCVGARPLLLAWNVFVEGVSFGQLRGVAAEIRERGGGLPSLRALAFELKRQGRLQISMNVEDLERCPPLRVYRRLERRVGDLGGALTGTEVIGMYPDGLVLPAAEDRLRLLDPRPSRLLSARLADHLSRRAASMADELLDAIRVAGEAVPPAVRAAAARFQGATGAQPTSGENP